MNYTTGNWTVTSLTTDTITTPKTLSIVDLDYANDFAESADDGSEATLQNVTGSGFTSPEKLRYMRTPVANVYNNSNVPTLQQFAQKSGYRLTAEVAFNLKATNSVSGAEVLLPLRGWICLVVPNCDVITGDAVEYLLKRAVSAAFDTGSTDETRMASLARGVLVP